MISLHFVIKQIKPIFITQDGYCNLSLINIELSNQLTGNYELYRLFTQSKDEFIKGHTLCL